MGKRTGQLAGLAALGALGYMLSRDKKGESSKSETRSSAPSAAPSEVRDSPRMQSITAAEGAGEVFDASSAPRATGARASAVPTPAVTPTRITPSAARAAPAAAPAATPAAARAAAPSDASKTPAVSDTSPDDSRSGRVTSAPESDDVPGAAAAVARFKQETAGMPPAIAQGRAPMTKRQPVVNTYTRKMGAQAGEAEAYRAAQAARAGKDNRPDLSTPEGRKRAEQAQALERVYPEQAMIAPGAKGVAALAKGLANRSPRLSEMTMQSLPAPTARLTGPSASALKEAERAKRAATRQAEMRAENASRYGLDTTSPGARALRNKIDGEGFVLRKNGGAVKKMASGGMTVSKASSRADGIAQRGKTRGKLY